MVVLFAETATITCRFPFSLLLTAVHCYAEKLAPVTAQHAVSYLLLTFSSTWGVLSFIRLTFW